MADPRHQKLAQVLIHYSLAVKPGEKLQISGPAAASPLLREAYREALRAGAHVVLQVQLDGSREIFYKEATDEQLQHVSKLDEFENEYFDAGLFIMGDTNTRLLSGVDSKRMAMRSAARKPLNLRSDEREVAGEYRWCLTLFPTQAYAQDADMSLEDYENFVFNAGLLNTPDPVAGWKQVHEEQQRICEYLNRKSEIHIIAPDTDITYNVGGRTWINADGKVNFPDGEVFSAPIEDSVNGVVRFSFPAIYAGNEVNDVRLTFKDGLVVEASAAKGQDFLYSMLDMDSGSRRLGEVAFGTNYNIQNFSREMLFDEKIGGTMHMALGQSYGTCGGKNESGLHWDMLADLRAGRVYADGELCYENGKFII
ncbi:MAG: aminopeptidase [Anaerolineae bacterium]|nr:aminopeptidase [Anaerolineae bacterium]